MSAPNGTVHRPAVTVAALLLRRGAALASFFAVSAVVLVAGLVAILAATGSVDRSGWTTLTTSAVKYWMLVLGILIGTAYLRPMVAHGVTRRHFMAGAGLFIAAETVAFAVFGVLGYAVERAIYDAAGWLPGLDEPYPVNSPADAARRFGMMLALYLSYALVGWLISVNYLRYGGWLGTALVAPAILPAAVPEVLFAVLLVETTDPPVPYGVGLAASAAAIALGAGALRLVMRDIPIRNPATA
jgi:hypothetical protein